MRRLIAAAVVAVSLGAAPAAATPVRQPVTAQFAAFGPAQVDVVPGDTVEWTNSGGRPHTVTSDTDLFDSGQLEPDAQFAWAFDDVGTFGYHCTIHPAMVGEIDVRRVTLGPMPTAPVVPGARFAVGGRAADASRRVEVQRSADGVTWKTEATATPAADGTWSAVITPSVTGDYRAAVDAGVSQTRRLLVNSRRVRLRATRTGVRVTVKPSAPYARIVLELHLRERFGWWPVTAARLDYVSQADLRVSRPARVRVLLVDRDGWTPLAISPAIVLGHA